MQFFYNFSNKTNTLLQSLKYVLIHFTQTVVQLVTIVLMNQMYSDEKTWTFKTMYTFNPIVKEEFI